MKVKCIRNSPSGVVDLGNGVTVDKIYQVLDSGHIGGTPVYYLVKDNKHKDWVSQSYFITLEEQRHNKLNELGI
jgi:hypothetical protein